MGFNHYSATDWTSLNAQLVKNQPVMRETWVQSLGLEDPLEKGKATHSNILAWRIPWTLLSMGSQRVTTERLSLSSPTDELSKLIRPL